MKSHRFTKKSPRKTVVRLVTGTLVAMALGACGDDLEAPSEGEDASLGEPVELAQDDLEALAPEAIYNARRRLDKHVQALRLELEAAE